MEKIDLTDLAQRESLPVYKLSKILSSIMDKLMTESSSIGHLKENVVSISRNPEERLCSQLYCKVERTLKDNLDIYPPGIK